jgi:hypothetical protein
MLDFDSIPRIIVLFWFHFFELSRELETELRTEIVLRNPNVALTFRSKWINLN